VARVEPNCINFVVPKAPSVAQAQLSPCQAVGATVNTSTPTRL